MTTLNATDAEKAHLLAGPHAQFCSCLAGIHQQSREVRRAALEELHAAVHAALGQLDEEEDDEDEAIVHSGLQQPCGF